MHPSSQKSFICCGPGHLPSRPREPSLPGQCERSDHRESTDTRQLIEVKPYRARLVLRWVTTLESRVALSFLFAIFGIFFAPPAPCAPPGPLNLHAKRSRKSVRHSNSSEDVSRAALRPALAGDGLRAKPWAQRLGVARAHRANSGAWALVFTRGHTHADEDARRRTAARDVCGGADAAAPAEAAAEGCHQARVDADDGRGKGLLREAGHGLRRRRGRVEERRVLGAG